MPWCTVHKFLSEVISRSREWFVSDSFPHVPNWGNSVTYFKHYFLGKGTFSRSDPSQYLFLYSSSLMSELVREGANIFNIDIIFPKYVIAQWQVLDAIKIHFKDHFKNCHSELLRSWIVNSQPPMAYWNISRINIMYNLKSAYLKQFR